MTKIKSEKFFQSWVMKRLGAIGHVQDHRFSALPDVPDLSAAVRGYDYWLELKYGKFRLGHDRYDRFEFEETTAGQLKWLQDRMTYGQARCGILGYINTTGVIDYLVFMPPAAYKLTISRRYTIGTVLLLNNYTEKFDDIKTGDDLVRFISGVIGTTRAGLSQL